MMVMEIDPLGTLHSRISAQYLLRHVHYYSSTSPLRHHGLVLAVVLALGFPAATGAGRL